MTSYWDQWQEQRREAAAENGLMDDFVEANTVVLTTLYRALLKYAPDTTTDSVYELALPVMEERGTDNPIVGMFVGHVLNLMIEDKKEE